MCLFLWSPQLSPFLYMQRLSLPSTHDRRQPVDKYPSTLILWVGQHWGFPVWDWTRYHSNYLCTLRGLPHFLPLHRVSLGTYPQINYLHSFVWVSVSGRSSADMGENVAGSRAESNSGWVGGDGAREWGKSQLLKSPGAWGEGLSMGSPLMVCQEGEW